MFSKFDFGIHLDEESWYSATPEEIAAHTADKLKRHLGKKVTIMDAFGGVGGNVIQFAKTLGKSVAVEIDQSKSLMCQNNCEIYKVENKVARVVSDYLKVTP